MIVRHVHTNTAVDVLRGKRSEVVRRFNAIGDARISMRVVVVADLRLGPVKTGSLVEAVALNGFLARFQIVDISVAIALRYSDLRADLELRGQRMGDNDLWIAAPLAHDAVLVTADDAFSRVPGLRTENWRLG